MDEFPAASRRFGMALSCEETSVLSVKTVWQINKYTRCKRASERRVRTHTQAGPEQLRHTPGSGPVSGPPGPDAAGGPPSGSWTDCWCPGGGGEKREKLGLLQERRKLLQSKCDGIHFTTRDCDKAQPELLLLLAVIHVHIIRVKGAKRLFGYF